MKASLIVPTNLSEISLVDYQKFISVQEVYPDNQNFLAQKMIEIFCHVKPDNVRLIKAIDVDNICRKITKVLESKPKHLVESFKLNGTEYWFHPELDEMSFGEYIDADSYMDIKDIHASMNVFYRPIKNKVGNKYTLEDYDPSKKDRLLHMPLDAVISGMEFFSFKQSVTKRYSDIFSTTEESTSLEGGFNSRWGWYGAIFLLARENVNEIENTVALNMHTCLNALSYLKDKSEVEMKKLKIKK